MKLREGSLTALVRGGSGGVTEWVHQTPDLQSDDTTHNSLQTLAQGTRGQGLQHAGAAVDWVVCWNRVMACGISNQYFLSFITVTWTAHSILIENNLIKNLTVKRDWELWMRLLVCIHQLGCSCTSAGAGAAHQLEL